MHPRIVRCIILGELRPHDIREYRPQDCQVFALGLDGVGRAAQYAGRGRIAVRLDEICQGSHVCEAGHGLDPMGWSPRLSARTAAGTDGITPREQLLA